MGREDSVALAQALRQCSHIMAQLTTVQKASLQQTYTLPDLLQRYHGKSEREIRDLMALIGATTTGTPGRPLVFLLDQVLMADSVISGRLDPKLLVPAIPKPVTGAKP